MLDKTKNADEALDNAFPPSSIELLLEEQNELLEKLLKEQIKSNERLAIIGQAMLKLINPPMIITDKQFEDVNLSSGYVTKDVVPSGARKEAIEARKSLYPKDDIKPVIPSNPLKEFNELKKGKQDAKRSKGQKAE